MWTVKKPEKGHTRHRKLKCPWVVILGGELHLFVNSLSVFVQGRLTGSLFLFLPSWRATRAKAFEDFHWSRNGFNHMYCTGLGGDTVSV